MGLFVCTMEALLTVRSSQCGTEGQCNRAGRAGKQIITNRTPTAAIDRSQQKRLVRRLGTNSDIATKELILIQIIKQTKKQCELSAGKLLCKLRVSNVA